MWTITASKRYGPDSGYLQGAVAETVSAAVAGSFSNITTGFPDASTTGVPAGTTLTTVTTDMHITTDDTVVDSKFFSEASIIVDANNVTIQNCKIDGGGGAYCVMINSGNLIITDCELTNFSAGSIEYSDYVATRLNIHTFTGDGTKLGDNVTIQDSYIHDFTPSDTAHADGGQAESGASNLTIKHNTIDATASGTNSCIFLKNDLGGSDSAGPVLVDSNLFSGGNYSLYAVPGSGGLVMDGITVTNNRFVRDSAQFGPIDIEMTIDTWSGNVYDDNDEVITD